MKRFIRRPTIQPIEVEWEIEIFPLTSIESATSILDTTSREYESFVDSMIDMFDAAGYDLYRDSRYTHPSNNDHSQSFYYTFLKIEDDVEVRVVVHVRISDHVNQDKKWASARQRRQRYIHKIAEEISNEYGSTRRPMTRDIEIIFDDETYCKSYAAAEFQIRDQIEDLEEAYQEWKQANL